MASLFESSHSLSMSRLGHSTTGLSLADQLPDANFGFDELRERMAKFTAKFDAFIEQGRKRVLEERNQFRMNVAELQEDQRQKKKEIDLVQLKTNTHQQTAARETAETREMQATIAALTAQRDRQSEARDALASQIAETKRAIASRQQAARARQQHLEAQARFNVPELDFWVTNLCLRIEGAGKDDRLKFTYTHVDERNWEREAWFELSTQEKDYDVKHTRPKLEREKVEKVLVKVNETRELAALLKGMRELFVEAMKA